MILRMGDRECLRTIHDPDPDEQWIRSDYKNYRGWGILIRPLREIWIPGPTCEGNSRALELTFYYWKTTPWKVVATFTILIATRLGRWPIFLNRPGRIFPHTPATGVWIYGPFLYDGKFWDIEIGTLLTRPNFGTVCGKPMIMILKRHRLRQMFSR